MLSGGEEQFPIMVTRIYVNNHATIRSMINLRKIRQQRSLSLRTLGAMAGVHSVSLVRLEAGKFDPRLSTLRKLAQALEVSVCDLIDQPQPKKKEVHNMGLTKRKDGWYMKLPVVDDGEECE